MRLNTWKWERRTAASEHQNGAGGQRREIGVALNVVWLLMVWVFDKPLISWDCHRPPSEWANELFELLSDNLFEVSRARGDIICSSPHNPAYKGDEVLENEWKNLTVLFFTLLTFCHSDDGWRKEHATSCSGIVVSHVRQTSIPPTFVMYDHVRVGSLQVLWASSNSPTTCRSNRNWLQECQ